jgi:hypothetical protein
VSKFLKIGDIKDITPPGLDGHRYRLSFQVGEQQGDVFHSIQQYSVDIDASRTLQSVWGSTDAQMTSVSSSSAVAHALILASENRLDQLMDIKLNTFTAPKEPPQSPVVQPGALFPIGEAQATPSRQPGLSLLSDDISELRDQINAIAKDLWGDRIFLLSQERPLLDMYKPVRGPDEFRVRIQSLGIIVKDVNKSVLAKVSGESNPETVGGIVLLQRAMESVVVADEANTICSVLKNINAIRQGYPTHGDNAKQFLEAHRFFKLPYPIQDYETAWESILGEYFRTMRCIKDGLSVAWARQK